MVIEIPDRLFNYARCHIQVAICSRCDRGNTSDVKSLVPIVERLQARFRIGQVCVVADWEMFSAEAIEREARFDGKWVLKTNSDLDAAEVTLGYKQLWTLEALFRPGKSLLETRPIYHK